MTFMGRIVLAEETRKKTQRLTGVSVKNRLSSNLKNDLYINKNFKYICLINFKYHE